VKLKWSEVDITNVAAIHVSWRFGSMMPPTWKENLDISCV
jgi:hypothetical protein